MIGSACGSQMADALLLLPMTITAAITESM